MSVNFQQLKLLVSQNKGHLYDYGRDGLIVANLSGKEILHISTDGEHNIAPQDIERVEQFFSNIDSRQVEQEEAVAKPITWIDIEIPVLESSAQMVACSRALMEMDEHCLPVVRIHFDKAPVSWQDLLSPFVETLQGEPTKGTIGLQLHGTFTQMEDSMMDFLFDNRVQIYYISEPTSFSLYKDIICSLSEYGFRVPCVCYVDDGNIHGIASLIDEAMRWNYDAGFSLPLATERIVGLVKNNPSNVDYLRLILDIYKKYPCYDEVFYPMNAALLESIGVTRDSRIRTWRWNNENSSFYEHFHESNIDKIHKILRHSFIWQRHIVQNKLETLLSKDCLSATKDVETETSGNVV